MRVLYIHPFFREAWNVGDSIYFYGTKELLLSAIGEHEVVKGTMEDFKRDVKNIDKLDKNIDLIVTTGSPWLQANFHNNWMSKALLQINKRYPNIPKIAFGLGGCCGLNKTYFHNKSALDITYNIFKEFNLVFTREPMTNQFMYMSGIQAHNTLDSAVFFPMDKFTKPTKVISKKPVMVYFDSTTGISRYDYSEPEHNILNNYYSYVYTKYNPDVYVVRELELDKAKAIGIDNVKWLHSLEDVISMLSTATFVLSGRVHQATLSILLGNKTYVVPYDIRYLCCTSIGAIPIINPRSLTMMSNKNKPNFYKDLIKRNKEYIVNQVKKLLK